MRALCILLLDQPLQSLCCSSSTQQTPTRREWPNYYNGQIELNKSGWLSYLGDKSRIPPDFGPQPRCGKKAEYQAKPDSGHKQGGGSFLMCNIALQSLASSYCVPDSSQHRHLEVFFWALCDLCWSFGGYSAPDSGIILLGSEHWKDNKGRNWKSTKQTR